MTGGGRRPAVFLDRDGVLNRPIVRDGRPYPPGSVEEFEILPGSPEACDELHAAGYAVVVVTNQPDIARGTQDAATVEAIHQALRGALYVDAIYVCAHDDADGCRCRKPQPGLLVDAATNLGIDLGASFMVGDRWRDIEAGRRAGCRTILVERGYRERQAEQPDTVVSSLPEAVSWIRRVGSHDAEVTGG